MAKTQRQHDKPTRSQRVRSAMVSVARAVAATTACILWGGLALPGLQLLPGTGGFGDQSISISLQSALLGIDGGHASSPEVLAAMHALGLSVTNQSAPPRLRSASGRTVSLDVQVADSTRVDKPAPTSTGSGTEGREDVAPDQATPTRPRVDPTEPDEPGEPAQKPGNGGAGDAGGPPQAPQPVPPKLVQSITFTTSPAAAVVGGSYSVGASASSGLPVSFSDAQGSAGVCTVSGTTVALVGTGTCTVRANQAGNDSYLPAAQVTQSFAVVAAVAVQTISFTSSPPAGALVVGSAYQVTAEATSGLPVEFGAEGESAGVCTVTGSAVAFVGVGTCTINANQSGNGSYQPAPEVQQSFTIVAPPSLSSQTITFTSSPPSSAVYVGPSYVVTATASSGLPITFTVSGTCTLSGSTVAMAGVGTCTVYADQSGNGEYLAAPQVQQTFSISKSPQTITFPDPGDYDKNDPPFALSATSSSGLAVTYTLDPSSTPFCSLSGNVVTPIDRGDCIVSANQAGDANYSAAAQVTMLIKIKNHTPGGG